MSAASPARRHRSGLYGLLALGALAACSSVPDWANPVAWYDNVFGDEVSPSNSAPQSQSTAEGRQRLEEAQKAPEPKVGSVPERPRATPREERTSVSTGLAADRDAARYTDEELRGRPASSSNLASPPPAAPPAPAVAAAPPPAPATPPAPSAAHAVAAPPPAPTAPAPPPAPSVATAPLAPTPPTAPPQPVAPTAYAGAPVAPTAPPVPAAPGARPVATLPPPPAGGPVAPIRDTSTLESTYLSALSQSAATVTTAPANAAFATSRPAALQRPATAVPANVLESYHASAPAAAYIEPPQQTAAAAPRAPLAALPGSGLPPVNQGVPFDRAGSRLVGTVEFPSGGATLDRRDREVISSALAQHNTRGGTIRVVGYAPPSAGTVGAFRLSQDRANAVANELVKEGANRQYVFVEARGRGSDGTGNRVEVYLEN